MPRNAAKRRTQISHQCFLNLPIFDHPRLTCLLLQILIASIPLLANSAFI